MAAKTRKRGVSDATSDVQEDLRTLREDLGTLAEEVAGLMSTTGNEALDEVKDRIRRIRSSSRCGGVRCGGARPRHAA